MKTRNFKFMLLLVIAFVSVSFTTSVFGQVPEKMSYQAVVRNASNELIVNKQIGVLISITQGIFPPISVYSETHIGTTNSNGLLTLQLGGGKLVSGNFSTIKWENGNVSVSANYDLSGGTNYTLLSSSQLLSVPYALYAKTAGNATGGITCPDGTTVGEIKYWNGTSWIAVAPSLNGMVLTLEGGVPVWKENKNTTVTFSVNTLSISNVTINSVKCEGFVTGGSVQTERGVLYGTSPNLTISSHDRLLFGKGTGNFTMDIIDLIPNTKYYVRTYATNPLPNTTETTTVYGEELSFTTLTITDIEGNVYTSVTIGTQTWMVENLKTTKYRNGDPIPNVTDNTWATLTTGAQCDFANTPANSTNYGKLYNWFAVHDVRNIAPTGWHIPTDAEWTILENYVAKHLGTSPNVVKALAATTDWTVSTTSDAVGNDLSKNNSSGFGALPGSSRSTSGFGILGNYGGWWSDTALDASNILMRGLSYDGTSVNNHYPVRMQSGLSVRCIKD